MKVALVHDWLVTYRGGEKVLATFCELFPEAPIYTLFYDKEKLPEFFQKKDIRYPKYLSKLGFMRKALLPFYPALIESFDLSSYDLIISTSSCVAKGAITNPDSFHLSYIHSPMRYIWDQRSEYLSFFRKNHFFSFCLEFFFSYLRLWDTASACRIDCMIANSSFVQKRIRKFYGKDSILIYPPIQIPKITKNVVKKDYFIAAGAMTSYKRFDLAILACEAIDHPLIVAGNGEEFKKLKKLSKKPTTVFIKDPSDQKLFELLSEAKALIFPGVEDFGMIAAEAIALGTPVIAYKRGGAEDFIIPYKTGIFFDSQDPSCLSNALKSFDPLIFEENVLKDFARKFDKEHFICSIKSILAAHFKERLAYE